MKTLPGGQLAGGNPTRGRVADDFYATPPEATRALLEMEDIIYPALEPACGAGHISKELDGEVVSTDLVYRGYGEGGRDFLNDSWGVLDFKTVITNPPFALFQEFAEKALHLTKSKVILFGKIQALEGAKRATFMEGSPLKTVYVFKRRQQLLPNGVNFEEFAGRKSANTMCFAWYVWEQGYEGDPIIKWL